MSRSIVRAAPLAMLRALGFGSYVRDERQSMQAVRPNIVLAMLVLEALREAGVVAVEEGGGMNLSGMDVGNAGERLRRCIAEVLPSTAKI